MSPSLFNRPLFSLKRRAVLLLLSLFAVWPVAHGYLVEHYSVNPWRLFGWAMYCVPTYEPQIRFFGIVNNDRGERGRGEIEFPRHYPPAQVQLELFIRSRGQLGDLASAEVLAAELFDFYPKLDGLMIAISHPIYRSDSSRFEPEISRYSFERRAPGATSHLETGEDLEH